MAPASRLKAAGVKPEGTAVYEMSDGRPVEMKYGFARVSFIGAETVAQVILGPEGCDRSWVRWLWRTPESSWTRGRARSGDCTQNLSSIAWCDKYNLPRRS